MTTALLTFAFLDLLIAAFLVWKRSACTAAPVSRPFRLHAAAQVKPIRVAF